MSCASTSELFASPTRPTACRRSRNCVTCVDSSIRHTRSMCPRRLTTTRTHATWAIPRSLLPSVVKQQTEPTRTTEGASDERRAPRRYGESRLRQDVEASD